MKRTTLEATDQNILDSIKDNTYGRTADVKDFIEALDKIEGNMFISLDARWGEGKTFYVRQIEKSLEYLTKKTWDSEQPDIVNDLKSYFQGTVLNSINLDKSYLPIYYNAWLYDNHNDPLLSLLFTIVKKSEIYLETEKVKSLGEKLAGLLSAVSISIGYGNTEVNAQVSVNGEKIKEAFNKKDILDTIKTAEEIRSTVKVILDEVVVEKAQRLVIFIDELDRCRPSYAIEMLERIKHYFDDERIIFIVSVNKEQLVHTISKYYGANFDSTGYLNKFFDLNVHMPVITNVNTGLFDFYRSEQVHLQQISEELIEYYKLSLRDTLIFKQRLEQIQADIVNDYTSQGCCLSLFIPIIAILDIIDENEKAKFLTGNSEILEHLSSKITAIHKMVCRLGDRGAENAFEIGFERVKAVYEYTFKSQNGVSYNKLVLDVSADLKRICIKLCNGFM